MKYVICWFDGERWGSGCFTFYSESGSDVTMCKKFTDSDGKVLEPFVAKKRYCRVTRNMLGHGKVIPLWLGKLLGVYNAAYNAYLNYKLGF